MKKFLWAIPLLMAISSVVDAAIIVVDSRAGKGDYPTIGQAVLNASNDDTIYISPDGGEYTEVITLTEAGTLTGITLIGEGRGHVVWNVPGDSTAVTLDNDNDDWTFRKIKFVNSSSTYAPFELSASNSGADGVTIKNCIFDGFRAWVDAVGQSNAISGLTVRDCSFVSSATSVAAAPMDFSVFYTYAVDNLVFANNKIILSAGITNLTKTIYLRNTTHARVDSCTVSEPDSIGGRSIETDGVCSNISVGWNTLSGGGSTGHGQMMYFGGASTDNTDSLVVRYNTVSNIFNYGIEVETTGATNNGFQNEHSQIYGNVVIGRGANVDDTIGIAVSESSKDSQVWGNKVYDIKTAFAVQDAQNVDFSHNEAHNVQVGLRLSPNGALDAESARITWKNNLVTGALYAVNFDDWDGAALSAQDSLAVLMDNVYVGCTNVAMHEGDAAAQTVYTDMPGWQSYLAVSGQDIKAWEWGSVATTDTTKIKSWYGATGQ